MFLRRRARFVSGEDIQTHVGRTPSGLLRCHLVALPECSQSMHPKCLRQHSKDAIFDPCETKLSYKHT